MLKIVRFVTLLFVLPFTIVLPVIGDTKTKIIGAISIILILAPQYIQYTLKHKQLRNVLQVIGCIGIIMVVVFCIINKVNGRL